uniref:Retrotransposon Copia-like N-terminal domain-containing protein n=1 Tax=Fagus sylvatica TaxID=28930 RepID=A0A2N9J5T9_FAGSY
MTTSTPSSTLSLLPTPTHLPVVHHLVTIKLTRDNYLRWKAQIVPFLRGQHLFGFLDASRPAPPQTLTVTTDAYVFKCTTSREVWLTLERMFTAHSRARVMNIHYQLSTLKKGDSSIADYFHKFTGLIATLAAIDKPLTEEEQVSFLLAGLGSEFKSFVTTIQMRTDLLFIEALYGHLLSHELRMAQAQPKVDLSLAGAHFASRGGSFSRGGPIMVVVEVVAPPTMALLLPAKYVALLATPQTLVDETWYADFGATHHLTADLVNLNVRADEYHDQEQIRVGNGSGNEETIAAQPE